MRPPILLSAVLLALGIGACAERLLGPADVSGSYVLIRYDGVVPPVSYSAPGGCTVTVYGGSLTLGADGSFSLDVERDRQCPGPAGLQWVGVRSSGSFQLIGPIGVELRFVDGTGADVGLSGTLVGTHVRVSLPQPSGVSPGIVTAEFAAGATTENGAVPGDGAVGPPPLPDTEIAIVTKRP